MRSIAAMLSALMVFQLGVAQAGPGYEKIRVMTLNQYLGADIAPLFDADAANFNSQLVQLLQTISKTRFKDRVNRIARLVEKERPHVIAFQEVFLYDCKPLSYETPQAGCNDPSISGVFGDRLDETLAALRRRGLKYRAVSIVKNLDLSEIQSPGFPPGLPFVINGVPALFNAVDRDVLLVRNDLAANSLDLTGVCAPDKISANGCIYQALASTTLPTGGQLEVKRGFTGLDTKIGKINYRIINTHLEVREPRIGDARTRYFQSAQAQELLAVIDRLPTASKVMVLADINSSPEDKEIVPEIVPPYQQFAGTNGRYTDIWNLSSKQRDGTTCCQLPDLTNKKSELYERIDMIFSKELPAKLVQVRKVGAVPADKTKNLRQPKLWPTDHAGVSAVIRYR